MQKIDILIYHPILNINLTTLLFTYRVSARMFDRLKYFCREEEFRTTSPPSGY